MSDETGFRDWAVRLPEFYESDSRAEREFLLTRMLIMAARRWTTYIDETIKQRTGQSRARWHTLSVLCFSETSVTTLELADRMAVRWPTMVKVLNDLEREGMVTREANPHDGRSRLIAITPKGRRMASRVQDIVGPLRQGALEEFSDAELTETRAVLDRLFLTIPSQIAPDNGD